MLPRGGLNMAAGKGKGTKGRAGEVVCIKDHVPVVVTQEDVDKYGSVEPFMNGRVKRFATN